MNGLVTVYATVFISFLVVIMEKDESFNACEKTLKITDFDRNREQDYSKACIGTYQWMAPEVLNDSTTFHKTSDVWRSVLSASSSCLSSVQRVSTMRFW